MVVLLFIIILGGIVFAIGGYNNGEHNFGLSLYLAFITSLTVGYGDLTPDGPIGKIFAIILAIVGMLLMGIIVGACVKALERSS